MKGPFTLKNALIALIVLVAFLLISSYCVQGFLGGGQGTVGKADAADFKIDDFSLMYDTKAEAVKAQGELMAIQMPSRGAFNFSVVAKDRGYAVVPCGSASLTSTGACEVPFDLTRNTGPLQLTLSRFSRQAASGGLASGGPVGPSHGGAGGPPKGDPSYESSSNSDTNYSSNDYPDSAADTTNIWDSSFNSDASMDKWTKSTSSLITPASGSPVDTISGDALSTSQKAAVDGLKPTAALCQSFYPSS